MSRRNRKRKDRGKRSSGGQGPPVAPPHGGPSWGQDDAEFRRHLLATCVEQIEWYFASNLENYGDEPVVFVLNLASTPGRRLAETIAGPDYVEHARKIESDETVALLYYASEPEEAHEFLMKITVGRFRGIKTCLEAPDHFLAVCISEGGMTFKSMPKPLAA
jgi:hypothetical protein